MSTYLELANVASSIIDRANQLGLIKVTVSVDSTPKSERDDLGAEILASTICILGKDSQTISIESITELQRYVSNLLSSSFGAITVIPEFLDSQSFVHVPLSELGKSGKVSFEDHIEDFQ